jgi:membrane protease YdiL (CAAX protease family)
VTPERRRALVEVVVCSGYPTQLALAGSLQSAGIVPRTADGELSLAFIVPLTLVDAIVILALVVFFLRRGGDRPSAIFLGGRHPAREAALGLVLLPVTLALVFGVITLLQSIAPWLRNVPENPFERLLTTRAGFVAFLIVALVAGGLREELQRAFLLHRFERHLGGRGLGLIVTSLAFGFGHTLQGRDAAVVTGLLGLCWGALYLARRSAMAPIVNHALFNATQLIASALKLS